MPCMQVLTCYHSFFQGVLLLSAPSPVRTDWVSECEREFSLFHHPARMRMLSVNSLCQSKGQEGRVLSNTLLHWVWSSFTLGHKLPINIAPCPSSDTSYQYRPAGSLVTDRFVPVSKSGPLSIEIVVGDVARQHADLVLSSDVGAISFVPPGHISVTS